MLTFHRILHPTDFSDTAAQAFDHAVHLARRYDAALHVVHIAEVTDLYYDEDEDLQARLRARMDELLARHDLAGLSVTPVIDPGEVAVDGILDYAGAHGVDLLVLGTHGRRGLRRLFVGSVAAEVARRATCPVLAVRQNDPPPDKLVDAILVPLDLSDTSRAALPFGKDLAAQYESSRLHVLHVFEDLNLPPIYGDIQSPILAAFPEVKEKVLDEMQRWTTEAEGPNVATTYVVKGGRAVETILAYVEAQGIDLVVLTQHGSSGFARFLLGSVAERVMMQASVPVFLIPTARPA